MHPQVLGLLVPQDDVQDTEFDSWSELTTVTSFDAGTTQPVDEMEGQGMVLQDVKCFSSTSLLVESLIEQLCNLLEKDKTRRKKLYDEICHKLHHMKLIDETYQVEEFSFMRTHYQKALIRLLSTAKSEAISSGGKTNKVLMNLSSSLNLNASHLQHRPLLDTSRYLTEFEELEYIAKGGFGRVHKARNKLDDTEYAMKKICLRYRNINCFLRSLDEVKMLAKLNHPNIVSYKAAWLEPFSPAGFVGKNGLISQEELTSFLTTHTSTKSSRKIVFDSVSDEDSYGVVFKDSKSGDKSTFPAILETSEESVIDIHNTYERCTNEVTVSERVKCKQFIKLAASNEDSYSSEETENANTSLEDIADREVCEYRGILANPVQDVWKFGHSITTMQQEWATLYIQMQLCDCTLRQWLDQRNAVEDLQVNLQQSVAIFYQIVCGVEYIHSQRIVHHDIKPSNIFVNEDLSRVQVGDFGLACFLQHSTPDMTIMTDESRLGSPQFHHNGEVGTRLYAAPEQLCGKCDPKSDLYSLGVVLFELLQPFTTDMERSKVIENLKKGKVPSELSSKSPKLAQLINILLSTSAGKRPTASMLLSNVEELMSEISNQGSSDALDKTSDETTIQQLRNIISEKDREIEELKRLLSQKEQNNGNCLKVK